jgi:myo-inositol-1(or 4)-monophosphatase
VKQELQRIREALDRSVEILAAISTDALKVERKGSDGPVTEADRAINDLLRSVLPRDGEGWLSEESVDDPDRLGRRRVWVVDPLDGTQEFVEGIPEWCISIGLVDDGVAVAGGICNPATRELFLGSLEDGVTFNGSPARTTACCRIEDAQIVASRSEVRRGEWKPLGHLNVLAAGSVAYKLALVAAGLADATWTLVPKNEWDVAAGAALVNAAGGAVRTLDWKPPRFNRKDPLLRGLIATGPRLEWPVREFLTGRRWLNESEV